MTEQKAIGAADAVRQNGYAVRAAGTRRADGKWLLKAPDGDVRGHMTGIHRRRLHAALVEPAHTRISALGASCSPTAA